MKKANDEHVGLKISLKDGTKGKVVRVSETGYRVRLIGGEKILIPLEEIKCNVLGQTVKLLQKRPANLEGKICQLQNCGEHSDGLVVKVGSKTKDGWRFWYSTGCGGEAPERCFAKLTKASVLDKSWHLVFSGVEKGGIACGCCGKFFPEEDLHLFFVPLKEWHKQGVACRSCLDVAGPLLNLAKTRPLDETANTRVGARALQHFNTHDLLELNTAVIDTMNELAKRHAINVTEVHKQIRPTAMEYTLCFKLPNDVTPEQAKAASVTALKAAKSVAKMNKGLAEVSSASTKKKRSAR